MNRLSVMCVALLLCSGCAIAAKQNVVVGLQAAESALEASHTAERKLCAPNADPQQAIRTCDSPVGLTTAVHLKLANLYSTAFDFQIKTANAVKVWRAGDPVPSDVTSYQKALDDVLTVLQQVVPPTADVVQKLRIAIDQIASIARGMGAK